MNGDELISVAVASNLPQAEFLTSLLKDAGIQAMARATNQGVGAGDGLSAGGAHDILVLKRDAESAREVLDQNSA